MLENRGNLPKLDHLLGFMIAAEHQSFAAAAKDMNVSETAISRKIRLLEEHYNTALFVRGHRSVTLTENGRRLLNGIRPAIHQISHVSDDIARIRDKTTVHLAATHSVASLWLMPKLHRFRTTHSGASISLMSSDLDDECLTTDLDLAILRGDGNWPGYEATRLFGETVFPICAPSYLENNPNLGSLSSLLDHALIEVTNNHTEWLNWATWLGQKDLKVGAMQHSTFVNTYPLAVQAAIDGLGVALGWGHLVDQYLEDGRLVCPCADHHIRTYSGYYLLQNQTRTRHPERDKLVKWLINESAARRRYDAR